MHELVIDGHVGPSRSGATRDIIDPADGQVFARAAEGGRDDVDRAVAAAARAYETWRWVAPRERAALLRRFAALLDTHRDELAQLESRNVGKPVAHAAGEVGAAVEILEYYAGAIDKFFGTTIPVNADGLAFTIRESLGVAALITPWNFPLNTANSKVAAALAAGNTCVLKPASITPLTSLRYGELALEAGLPSGVLNVVTGPGGVVGDSLAGHVDVAKLSFTGSTDVGAAVALRTAVTFKRTTLELGGKSACIVFADADLERLGRDGWMGAFYNAGQDCCARSRLLVEESAVDEVVERYGATVAALRVGDPQVDGVDMGPLASDAHRAGVERHVAAALDDGAVVAVSGTLPDDERLRNGFFSAPRVLTGVNEDMLVARTEIFGPVVTVTPFRDEAHAIEIANATPYGLSGSIWTRDAGRALRVARAVRSGVLSINTDSSVFPQAPFGGQKQSGVGRELGMAGLEANTDVKSVFLSTVP